MALFSGMKVIKVYANTNSPQTYYVAMLYGNNIE